MTYQGAESPGSVMRRLLNRDGGVVLPGVYDGMTGTLAERVGFEGGFLTGAGVSYTSIARGDSGFIGLGEMLAAARNVIAATSFPVLADADTGYGSAVNVYYAVQQYERAGMAGVMLEDQPMPKKCAFYEDMEVVSAETMVGKIRAARDARRDKDFIIIARTDSRAAVGLDEALRRIRMYEAAGADVVFPEALENEIEMKAAVQAVSVPSMYTVVEGSLSPSLSVEQLRAIGYMLIVYPNSIARAVAFTIDKLLRAIATDGTTDHLRDEMFLYDRLSELVSVPEDREREVRYRPGGGLEA